MSDAKIERKNGSVSEDGNPNGKQLQDELDAQQLQTMGHQQELKRTFSRLTMVGMAFAILNSWTALAASISISLPSGGPAAVIYGLVLAGICNLCLSASLAEMVSALPTSGGQYHWSAILATPRYRRGISWVVGWINVSAWIFLTATGGALGATLVEGVISFSHPDYEQKPWHTFLIYSGFTLIGFLTNAFGSRIFPLLNKFALFWSLTGVCVISITLLATAKPNFQSGAFVFGGFINETGWPDGMAWLLGLLQAALGLTGYDAVSHMVEEIHDPSKNAPRAMILAVCIGFSSGLVFMIVLLFCSVNINDVLTSSAGPLLSIFYSATNSTAGAICLDIFPIVCLQMATTMIMCTSSRMTYAFARDRGLPFPSIFANVNLKLGVPLYALIMTTAWVEIFGLLYLGSVAALNAILSASVVALGVSYAIPIMVFMLRGRRGLPPRKFTMPPWLGWSANIIGVAFVALTTVLFLFPPAVPVDGNSMNYTVVAFFVVLSISLVTWLVDGRKHYKGPLVIEIAE